MFRKNKKKKDKKEAEELKARLKELEGEPKEPIDFKGKITEPEEPEEEEDLDVLPEPPRPNKAKKETEPRGEFSLNESEMALAVNALANSEEFKLYQQMVIGQQAAEIIAAYHKAVGEKSEPEDTEELPEPK